MTEDAREYAMELLTVMVVADRASQVNRTQEEVLRQFRRSRTFAALYEAETGLWMNGSDYIMDEFSMELEALEKDVK